jgi:hypothetical protein
MPELTRPGGLLAHSTRAIHPSASKGHSPKFTPCLQARGVIPLTDAPSDLNDSCSRNHSCTPHERPACKVSNASGRWGSVLLGREERNQKGTATGEAMNGRCKRTVVGKANR